MNFPCQQGLASGGRGVQRQGFVTMRLPSGLPDLVPKSSHRYLSSHSPTGRQATNDYAGITPAAPFRCGGPGSEQARATFRRW